MHAATRALNTVSATAELSQQRAYKYSAYMYSSRHRHGPWPSGLKREQRQIGVTIIAAVRTLLALDGVLGLSSDGSDFAAGEPLSC